MVSQLTMPRICGLFACLTALFLFVPACGQNEGGRCQINSDCGSGLVCKDSDKGNGTCQPSSTQPTSDAAQVDAYSVVKADALVTLDGTEIDSTALDAGVTLDAAAVLDAGAAMDAAAVLDAGVVMDAAAVLDASVEDSGSFDSIGLD
jgi:hypothetical protein